MKKIKRSSKYCRDKMSMRVLIFGLLLFLFNFIMVSNIKDNRMLGFKNGYFLDNTKVFASSISDELSDKEIGYILKREKILIGSGSNINLDDKLTRNEMVVLLIRLLKKEGEVNNYMGYEAPFVDLDTWASSYVKYAYINGLTKGTDSNNFSGRNIVSVKEAETFLLRSLGYTTEKDFDFDEVQSAARKLGVEDLKINLDNNVMPTRRELNRLVYNTLNLKMKGTSKKLKNELEINLELTQDEEKNIEKLTGFIVDNKDSSNNSSSNNSNSNSNIVVDKDSTTNTNNNIVINSNKKEDIVLSKKDFNGKYIFGYLPCWSEDYYKNIDYSKITHLALAFYNPDGSLNITSTFSKDKTKTIIKKAHDNKCMAMLSIGGAGYGDCYLSIVSKDSKMDLYIDKLFKYAKDVGADGIDVDIEGDVDKKFWNSYANFIAKLRKRSDKEGMILTTAVSMWYGGYISNTTLDKFDLVNIMAYDNDESRINHSTLEYAKESLDYFEKKGIGKDKLILGVPFYGYKYDIAGRMSFKNSMTYANIIKYDKSKAQLDTSGEYRYNGMITIGRKCDVAKKYKGIMIWSLNQDSNDKYSLLGEIYNKFKK